LPGEFGVRIENLLLVKPAARDGFLCFENLTFVPYDLNLIDEKLLTSQEHAEISAYHATISGT
jgi:Xaa-Pro aminopeptidase